MGNLHINQDLRFQKRMWRIERGGWAAMALLVLSASAGLFGQGPVSRAIVGDPSSLMVDYERFVRYGSPLQLRVSLPHINTPDGSLSLKLNREFLNRVRVSSITPHPTAEALLSDGVRYDFTVAPGEGTALVTVHLQPQGMGPLTGEIRRDDGARIALWLFVFP